MPTSHRTVHHWRSALLVALATSSVLLVAGSPANAAIVPTVPLLTAANYSVLGSETVTNTNNSVLDLNLGLSPGTSIVGFPPGIVEPPATIDRTNEAAAQAKVDLTAAYLNAAGRTVDAEVVADLTGLTLAGGVYAVSSKGAMSLSGNVTLDGGGDPSSVFIFQTNSTLITSSGSTVTLINGAQECNVFWQVGSSATLGSGSTFVGTIMALTSVTVNNSVTVRGRALAQTGSVTLDNDTFTAPTCNLAPAGSTTTVVAPTSTLPGAATTTTVPLLPGTGRPVGTNLSLAIAAIVVGAVAIKAARRRVAG